MNIRRIAFAGLMALTLAGCGTTASKLLDFGADKDQPLTARSSGAIKARAKPHPPCRAPVRLWLVIL